MNQKDNLEAVMLREKSETKNQQADSIDLIDSYIGDNDWKINENANMGKSIQGMNIFLAGSYIKHYWLNKVYTPEIKRAYLEGEIHVHDLDSLSPYCMGHDLKSLLLEGFTGVAGKASSKPAKHFKTALGQVCNFFFTLQGESAGAQAFSSFDTYLAPFIRYDNLSYSEVKQAMQEFVFNMNVCTRTGAQSPFTNVTLDLQCPRFMENESVIVGGELRCSVYGQFQKEMDMFNTALLEVLSEGDAHERVFTFPIPTYNITKDFDWNSPITEKLMEATAKYGIPTFSNYVNSDLDPEDIRSMCCRLRIDNSKLRRGSQFGSAPLTGSVGVVTINLPRMAILAKEQGLSITGMIREAMETSKESLEKKRVLLEELMEKNMYPYLKFYMKDVKLRHRKYFANHFSTIGILGMNEAVIRMIGEDIGTIRGQKTAEQILEYMKEVCDKFTEDTGNLYNLEATPAEGTSYRLAKKDLEKYGPEGFIAQGAGDTPYYTNSSHLPVNYSADITEILNKQDKLQSIYTGGTTLPIYLGENVTDPDTIKKFVQYVCNNFSLPYFTLNPVFSVCTDHGYIRGEHFSCPSCFKETEVYSRIVGYLRPVKQWNKGKKAEYKDRINIKDIPV